METTVFFKDGSAYIAAKIEEAVKDGCRTATVSGHFEIGEAIRLPSNFTLILDGAYLRMADGVYANMFVNEHHGTEIGKTVDGTDRNINIIGRGEAILDGGKYNGLSEKNSFQNGLPPIWKNNLILFSNVDGFRVSGIQCKNQRWWALNFIYCANGYVGDIDFCACDIGIDENGNEYHGLKRDKYAEVLVKNADGVDLRRGCHDIVIENISGFVEDDSVALTALNGEMEKTFAVGGLPSDLCRIEVRNVRTSAYCSNVRLLNQGEIRLHDITVDGVYDTSADSPYMDRGRYAVRVGDTHMYGARHSTADETYNITVKNIFGRGDAVLFLAGEIRNLVFFGIEASHGTKMLEDHRTGL